MKVWAYSIIYLIEHLINQHLKNSIERNYHRQKKTSEKQDEVQRRIEELGESHEKTLESIKVFHRLTSTTAPKSFL